jgi:transcriptional antiterminator RfaH
MTLKASIHAGYRGFSGTTIYQMADAEGRVMVLLNILSKQLKMSVPPANIRKVN